jgi:hypothetical protein
MDGPFAVDVSASGHGVPNKVTFLRKEAVKQSAEFSIRSLLENATAASKQVLASSEQRAGRKGCQRFGRSDSMRRRGFAKSKGHQVAADKVPISDSAVRPPLSYRQSRAVEIQTDPPPTLVNLQSLTGTLIETLGSAPRDQGYLPGLLRRKNCHS